MGETDIINFIFNSFGEAMRVHTMIYEIRRTQGYVLYTDVLKLIAESNGVAGDDFEVPDDYENAGWCSLFGSQVQEEDILGEHKWKLYMPDFKMDISERIENVKKEREEKLNENK